MPTPILLFARPPIPGRCKTRLAAAVGEHRAAALYEAFVIDTLTTVRSEPALAPELHVTDAIDHPFFTALCARFDLPAPVLQRAGDLGARMAHALGRAAPTILVGTDAPVLARAHLRAALGSLTAHDLALTPAPDGGYPLIASRAPAAFLIDPGIRWSSSHALADTMRAARAAGLSVALTAPAYDVDEPHDLALLATHLALDPAIAPCTAARLHASRF